MNDGKTILSAEEADKLLASADGLAALLCLHIRRSGGFSLREAARDLRRSEEDVALAANTLRRLGLLFEAEAPLQRRELPELTTRDIRDVAAKDHAFRGLVVEAEKTLGRVLSDNDLRILFGIYDHLGLPADVIMLLLHHCIEEYQERSGPGRMPTMRYIEKEGWHWAEQEILNLDAAEEHLLRQRERREVAEQLKSVLEIRGRSFTPSERKYVEAWLAMGFGPEALAIAYDRTVLRTGRLTWKYMDTILQSWSEKQLFTPEAIEAKDPAQRGKARADARAAGDDEKVRQMERMVAHLQRQNGKREE